MEFEFYQDRFMRTVERTHFTINAESREEALTILKTLNPSGVFYEEDNSFFNRGMTVFISELMDDRALDEKFEGAIILTYDSKGELLQANTPPEIYKSKAFKLKKVVHTHPEATHFIAAALKITNNILEIMSEEDFKKWFPWMGSSTDIKMKYRRLFNSIFPE